MKQFIHLFLIFFLFSCSQLTGPSYKGTKSLKRHPNSEAQVIPFNERAFSEPLYGMELTFTSENIKEAGARAGGNTINSPANMKAQKLLIKEILKVCGECDVEYFDDKYGIEIGRITYPDGHYIDVTLDPWVVEITGKPIPRSQLTEITNRLQRDVFDSARRLGLQPGFGAGGGHVHLGVQGLFNKDAKLFRDFMVDLYNHSEIGSGILNFDHNNSPPINALPESSQRAFWDIIQEFDEQPSSLKQLARTIYTRVHSRTVQNWSPPEKYHGINLMRLARNIPLKEQTVELRFIRPQQSANQFRLIAELFTKRIEFLKSERLAGQVPQLSTNHPKYIPENFTNFVQYIEETGLEPERFFRLLPADYGELSWNYVREKYPNDPDKLWIFLQEFAEDSPYDDDAKAKFILSKLEIINDIEPKHEKTMATLLERSYQSPSLPHIDRILKNNSSWSQSKVALAYRKLKASRKSFHRNCHDFLRDILFIPRAN